ncbi:hypothetical protein SETIT_9G374600v2 [Setaria italica]|uniref:TF-B3 domain-containing protein n=1 Tax=Setaria italica TaxID=4555 RepID=A0A368SPT5_SETIT|nr:hypothetical protein SETIT_9G374600v2 [Setaria italica]
MLLDCVCRGRSGEKILWVHRIPQAFNKFMENEPLGVVSLKGPSGNTWHAKLILDSEGFYFTHGWNEFFIDHNINLGEFLVFGYDGHSHFSIKVFDLTGCEKQSTFLSCPSKDVTKECEKGLMGIDATKTSHCPHEDYKGHNTMGGLQEDVDHTHMMHLIHHFSLSGIEKTRKLDILEEFSGSSQRANDRLFGASFYNRRKGK